MALQRPKRSSELRYFKRASLNKGKATVWVFSPDCPACKVGKLNTPYNEATGRYKSRSKTLVCSNCRHEVLKTDFKKEDAIANVEYVCPSCLYAGELQAPFKRNAKKEFTFKCEKCSKDIKVARAKDK